MLQSAISTFIPRRVIQFTQDQRGVSAVEFAMLLPLMVTLYLGGVEVSQAVSIDRKVTMAARTAADLVSQVASINKKGTDDVLDAAAAVISPYPIDKGKVTVTVVKIDANKNMTVEWSETKNGTIRTTVPAGLIPAALVVANTHLVWGESSYSYKPVVGYVLTGTLNLTDQIFMRPRLSDNITHPAV